MSRASPHHVGLRVADLGRSTAFYAQAFGFGVEVEATVPGPVRIVMLLGDAGFRIELFELAQDSETPEWPDPITALRAGASHFGLVVGDLERGVARAVEAGGREVWGPRQSPEPHVRIAFVADPDGNLIELLTVGEK